MFKIKIKEKNLNLKIKNKNKIKIKELICLFLETSQEFSLLFSLRNFLGIQIISSLSSSSSSSFYSLKDDFFIEENQIIEIIFKEKEKEEEEEEEKEKKERKEEEEKEEEEKILKYKLNEVFLLCEKLYNEIYSLSILSNNNNNNNNNNNMNRGLSSVSSMTTSATPFSSSTLSIDTIFSNSPTTINSQELTPILTPFQFTQQDSFDSNIQKNEKNENEEDEDNFHKTPLDMNMSESDKIEQVFKSCLNGNINQLLFFLDTYGDEIVNLRNSTSFTPLHHSCYHGQYKICQILLEHGADYNSSAKLGMTCLHVAVTAGNYEIVKLLLEYGADPFIQDMMGNTSLDRAKMSNHHNIVNLISSMIVNE